MKSVFLTSLFCFVWSIIYINTPIYASSGTTLQPSLLNQMQQQNKINKRNLVLEKIKQRKIVKEKQETGNQEKQYTLTPKITIPPASSVSEVIKTPKKTILSPQDMTALYPKDVDMERVRSTWLDWTNNVRGNLGLPLYSIDHRLNQTAMDWSEFSKQRGYITHGRPGDGCTGTTNYNCYNFAAVDTWFRERGINPIVKNRAKHTENIGIREYYCSESDCTNELIRAIEKTFIYFMNEKASNGVHYKSIVNPYFTKIGIGVTTSSDTEGVYYLTVHYITE